ncbi:MAG: hypothetical protein K8T26_10580 [Lentisphaerae bacterium]|nr:hypothetical protein [Lentisphaerota bacterium]
MNASSADARPEPDETPWQLGRASVQRIAALAVLAFRSALRSRLLLCMAAMILLVTFGLPATVAGDGTLAGTVRVLLSYTLGLSATLLSVAMLWSSCASIATEIEQGQLRLLRVGPVRALELWLGKWLGLLALSGLLLTIAGAGTYAMLHVTLRRTAAAPAERQALVEQVLVGQRALAPRPDDVTDECERRLEQYAAQGWNPEVVSRRKMLVLLRQRVLAERATVAPGQTRRWIIDMPRALPASPVIALRIRLAPTWGAARPLTGHWHVGPDGHPGTGWNIPAPNVDHGLSHVAIPASWVRPGEPFSVAYVNGPAETAGAVAFDLDRSVELLIRESAFGPNLMRALLVLWCQIGLLCALGLAASTCFSFPVAAFFASAVVLLALTGHYFTSSEATDIMTMSTQQISRPSHLQTISEAVLRGLESMAAPVVGRSPLAALSDGILISWGRAARDVAVLLGLYGGTLAAASAWLLHRRELAAGSR